MRLKVLLAVALFFGVAAGQCQNQASPYTNSVFKAQNFTATGQTLPVIQLNGLVTPPTVGSSFASGTITIAGTSLTTMTFAAQGSSDNGATFYPLPIYSVASPTSPPSTSVTVTANGLYQINLAGMTHIRFVTSGTFTATSVSITLTASPNALISKGGSSGGGATTPATALVLKGNGGVNGVDAATPGTDYVIPSGNVATANALAATPHQCGGSQFTTGIASNGDANCGTPAGSGSVAPAPQFKLPYYSLSGSSNTVAGDTVATTDGNGNYTLNSVNVNSSIAGLGPTIQYSNPTPNTLAGIGADTNSGQNFGYWNAGFGKNIGNAAGVSSNDSLWRVATGLPLNVGCWSSGICQAMHIFLNGNGAGDKAALYIGGNGNGIWSGGSPDASAEGDAGININGSQYTSYVHTTVASTSGTGDPNPTLNVTSGSLVNQGYLINTSHTVLSGTLGGSISSIWETNPYTLATLPISGGATPTTGICVTSDYIPASTSLGVPQITAGHNCAIHDGLALVTGPAWMASLAGSEQVTITVTGTSGGNQTYTVKSAGPHPIGDYIFQGGTQGLLSFDDDLSVLGNLTDFIVFGAVDSTHLIIGWPSFGHLNATNLPRQGEMQESLTSGFHIFPGARLVYVGHDGITNKVEQNTVPWTVADNIISPPPSAYQENLITVSSTEHTSASASFHSNGFHAQTYPGSVGVNHAWHPFDFLNQVPYSIYYPLGKIDAPAPFQAHGPITNVVETDDPLPADGTIPCGGLTLWCNLNTQGNHTGMIYLYQDVTSSATRFGLNRSTNTWSTGGAPFALDTGSTVNTKLICLADGTNCPPGGGATTPATTLVYKGTGSVNGVVAATPGTDYVLPSGNVATATTLAGNASANTIYQGPYSGAASPPVFAPLLSSQVTGALGFVPYQTPTLTGDLATGLIADYNFSQGSGTLLVDGSGNGNNATFGSGALAPAWSQGGVNFTYFTAEGISLPAAVNAGKTFVIAAYWFPITTAPCAVNWPGPGVCAPAATKYNNGNFPAYITSSMGSTGINFITSISAGISFGQPLIWDGSGHTEGTNGFSGFHVIVWVLGTGGGNLDHVYVDGVEIQYESQGSTAGAQTSGNLFIGSSNTGPWTNSSPQATFYRMRVQSTQYSAADAQAITDVFKADIANRGINTTPIMPVLGLPQLHCVGDSITAGASLVTVGPYCSDLTLTNQPAYQISNWGVPSETLQEFAVSEPNRVAPLCQSAIGGAGVVHVLAGVNDFNSGGTPASVYANLQGEVQSLKRGGCKVFVSTLLDFTATGSDANKNAYNTLIRTGIIASGADGIDDMAANPLLGADGAATNATYFNGGLHPTDAGEVLMAASMSNALNYYFGSNAASPTVVTATTYSMAAGDGYVMVQPTANQTLTLPNCLGQTGAVYTINNSQSAHTVGLKNLISAETINGIDNSSSALVIPSNSTVRFRDVPLAPSTGGCVWNSF